MRWPNAARKLLRQADSSEIEADFDAAAPAALLEAARDGDIGSAEMATGYYWGEPRLHEHVAKIRDRARAEGDDRLEQLAERFLR